MPVIGICSGKGGVGKTTVAANVSVALSDFGSVVVVDGDVALPNLHTIFGLEPTLTLVDVLSGRAGVREAIYRIRINDYSVDVLPSSQSHEDVGKLERFPEVLEELENQYDFVVVDVAAGLSSYALIPMMGCDELYLVVNPEETSIMDAWRVRKVIDRLNAEFGGVILNRYRGEKWAVAAVEKKLGRIAGIIRESKAVRRGWEEGYIVTAERPEAKVSEEFYNLARRIAGENVHPKPYGRLKYLLRL